MNKKILAIVAAALLLCVTVGGTMAYLFATTEEVVNTFTPGNVGVDSLKLWETEDGEETKTRDYMIVPGVTDDKDPKVKVATNIPAYLFIQFTEPTNTMDGLNGKILDYTSTLTEDNGWTQLQENGQDLNVWYRIVDNTTYEAFLLNPQTVKYNENLTSEQMATLGNLQLKWDAWTIQRDGLDYTNAADDNAKALVAWNQVKGQPAVTVE